MSSLGPFRSNGSSDVEVTARPRLHVCLVDLGFATPRKYGGAGIFLDSPALRISVAPAHPKAELDEVLPETIDRRTHRDIIEALARFRECAGFPPVRVNIKDAPRPHVGLGSKTSSIMGALVAVSELFQIPVGVSELQLLSGRGGTSGIGVNGFFGGGFVVDSGHVRPSGTTQFAPSSGRRPSEIPPVAVRLQFPPAWAIHLFLPNGPRVEGDGEVRFFIENTPVPDSEVLENVAPVYHGLVPAVATANYALLQQSLSAIRRSGFKRREIANQPLSDALISQLEVLNIACGMSSMGPLVYAVSAADGLNPELAASIAQEHEAQYLGVTRASSSGFSSKRV